MPDRYTLLGKLEKMLGETVKVYIDRPIGYDHKGIIYEQNYGYIKEYKAADGEYQDAYVIGVDHPVEEFEGKVIAIVNRKDDTEDKLIVCEKDKDFTNEEIEAMIRFQERYFKHKILRR